MKHMRFGEDDANEAAQNAVAWAYEECKFGRVVASTERDFWIVVSERLYKEKRQEMNGRFRSLDDNLNEATHASSYDFGWLGRTEANQIDYVAGREIMRALPLMPKIHREIIERLADGQNAIDISKALGRPLHIIFSQISQARNFLNTYDLIGMIHDR